MPRTLRTLTAAALATCALSIAIAMPSGAAAGIIGRGPVSDVVVNVTAGANDPVRGATVVARDDRTGTIMSSATTTGDLGYAVVRLRPGASTQRITITATGGRSQAVGRLTAADVMSATAQRGVLAKEIAVNVNPGSTVLAEYLDERPRASVAAAERAVARRLRLPKGTDVAESARFSRLRFSGEDFIDAARKRGGVEDYAQWAAGRIGAGNAVPSYADPRPADELPLRGAPPRSPAAAGLRREQAAGQAASVAITLMKPLIELGAKKAYCALGIAELCNSGTSTAPVLSDAEKKQLGDIERGISNLATQMTTTQQSLSAVEGLVAALGQQVAALSYVGEGNAVQDVINATLAAAALRAEGRDLTPNVTQALKNALVKRHETNSGCPNWAALVGALPPAAVMDGSTPRYPTAACTSTAPGVGPRDGLLQFAQRAVASKYPALTAGPTQAAVDSAGEFWLGEFAKNVFSVNAAAAYASRPGGTSTWTTETAEATAQLFNDAIELIEIDASGAYFGARIPADQVLRMGPSTGIIYGIGHYAMDPGACFGNGSGFMAWKRNPTNFGRSASGYFPTYDKGPLTTGACPPARIVQPPTDIPGAPNAVWASPDTVPAADLVHLLGPLRRAALCHLKDRVEAGVSLRAPSGTAAGGLCDPYPAAIPDGPHLVWPEAGRANKMGEGVLPNLQLSLGNASCHPWMVGFTTDEADPGKPREPSTPAWRLVTASGMQCPVLDLTPRASARYGWNCVKASPGGRIRMSGGPGVRATHPVTASLEILNNPTMGGYCPSLGARPAPTGAANVSYMVDATVVPSEQDLPAFIRWGLTRPTICSPAFEGVFGDRGAAAEYYQCAVDPSKSPRFVKPLDGRVLWPLQRQISTLTTYTTGFIPLRENTIPGYKSENWTYNNDVAGDFVVGPLHTSTAVGAYVPGTSPGGPEPSAPPRPTGASVPGPVTDLSICDEECTGNATSLRVTWRAPVSSGGLAIRRYEVIGTMKGIASPPRTCALLPTAELTCTFRDLDLSKEWDFRVQATNALGKGSPRFVSFTSGIGRPTLRALRDALEVRWTSPRWKEWGPSAGVPVPHRYTATASPGGRTCTTAGFTSTTCTISGLTPGTAYTVTVELVSLYNCYAKMPCGRDDTSPPSAAATPFGAPVRPGAPDLEAAVPSDGRIAVKWRAPAADGNSPIAGYTATAMPGGATCTTTGSLACVIDGLSPGTEYTVSVTATNEVGTGDASPSVRRTTPAVLPGPPLTPLAQVSPGTIEVSWVAPESNGGAAITGYTATASPGGAQCSTDGATTCTITGVPNGTDYQVTVTATNAVGTGRASVPAAARTPDITAPGAPRSVELTALPGRIEVAWSAPESDGGSAVTGYVATATPGGATCTTTGATECTITGLDDGTAYRVAVAAINVIGTGASSDAGEAVTPRRDNGGAPAVVDDLPLQAVAIPGTADSGLPASAPVAGRALELTGIALQPRTLVPGLGGRIAYSLSEPADVTITLARVGGRDRASRVVHRIPAGRPGALAGDSRVRVLYTRPSAKRKTAGAWRMTVEARDANGTVVRRTIPIRVRT